MTNKEKAIIMAYTGICMLDGEDFDIYHEYIQEIMGRPIYTHELADKRVMDEIAEKSKMDFLAICRRREADEENNVQGLEKILKEIESEYLMCRCQNNKVCDYPESIGCCYDRAIEKVSEIFRKYMNDGWIPVEERLPEDNHYILLSFTNFSLPLVGRYEKDLDGGAFYLGDCDEKDTCISMNLFVNAWMPLPEPYCPEEKALERKQEWKERMLRNFMKKGEK